MADNAIAANLLRLRKNNGLTQETLAGETGISRNAYRSLEKGRAAPKTETLHALARSLGVPVRELVTPVKQLSRVRFRSLKRLKRRDQVLAEVSRWLGDFCELEEQLGEAKPHALKPLYRKVQSARPKGMATVAAKVREQFGIEADRPVNDICGLLESRGVKVHALDVATDAFFGLSVAEDDGGPAVIVNTWERLAVEHWIFSAAHELGHLLLHLQAFDVKKTDEEKKQEHEANVFASHFLMPEAPFRKKWLETSGLSFVDRVLKVKRVFRVSWRTVVYRLAEGEPQQQQRKLWAAFSKQYSLKTGLTLKKLDEPHGVEQDIFRDPRVSPKTSQEPVSLDNYDFRSTRLSGLVRRGIEAGAISYSRAAEILGIRLDAMRALSASWVTD